jgi:hypothetical protein
MASCGEAARTQLAEATATATKTAPAQLFTPTASSSPTSTTRSTQTPIPSLTPAPVPTKDAIVVYERVGSGDGGFSMYGYFISPSSGPDIVIYSDGTILRLGRGWYDVDQLSIPEMCSILGELDRAMSYSGPIYNASPTPEYGFGNGEPYSHLATSGRPMSSVGYSVLAEDHLSVGAREPFRILEAFAAARSYESYVAEHFAVYLERVSRPKTSEEDGYLYFEWPSAPYQFPALGSLMSGREKGLVLVEGGLARNLIKYVGREPSIALFEMGGWNHVALVRPLLPHESIEGLLTSPFSRPRPISREQLPFQCP